MVGSTCVRRAQRRVSAPHRRELTDASVLILATAANPTGRMVFVGGRLSRILTVLLRCVANAMTSSKVEHALPRP